MLPPRPELATTKAELTLPLSRWEFLVKFALADYLNGCISGPHKDFFSKFAPYSQRWIVRQDVTWNTENPLDQAVQI